MKRFRLGYSFLVLILTSLFSESVNLYAEINSGREIAFGVGKSPEFLTKAGYLMRLSAEHVKDNVVTGSYLELVFGAIALCLLILFTMELLTGEKK